MERVTHVDQALVIILKSNPPLVGVAASGKVPTTGWSNPRLNRVFYFVPPADGIQDFSFDAEPPQGVFLPVVTPIAAHSIITRDPQNYWGEGKPLRGVRIHARENAVEAPLDLHPREILGDKPAGPYPWPWPWLAEGVHQTGDELSALQFAGITGMTLRVYHTGDVITMDYRLDRFNIELSRATERIVKAYVG